MGVLLIIGLMSIGGVCGIDVQQYNDISVVELTPSYELPEGNTQLNYLIYNASNGQILANVPINATYNYIYNYTTTTDANGVVSFNVNISQYNELQFNVINNTNIPTYGLSFYISGYSMRYWSSVKGYGEEQNYYIAREEQNYYIAKNGTINISIPASKFPNIEPVNSGNTTISVNGDYKVFNISNGFVNIFIKNITSETYIGEYGGGYEGGYEGESGEVSGSLDANLIVYPNELSIPLHTIILPDHTGDANSGEIIDKILLCKDYNNKPMANQNYTVNIIYDNNYSNIRKFNITTNEYGISTFNFTVDAVNYMSIEVVDKRGIMVYVDTISLNEETTTPTTPTTELSIYSNNYSANINEPIIFNISFKNGTTPIPNATVNLYSKDGFLGQVITDANGQATFTHSFSQYGEDFILGGTVYNNKLYGDEDYITIKSDTTQSITINNNKLIINAQGGMYKVVKNPMSWDDGQLLDSGFNASNKEIDLGVNNTGIYKIINYNSPYGSEDSEESILPYTINRDNLRTITKYTTVPYNITVKDKNGNPIPNATVICEVELYEDTYDYYNGNRYAKMGITDSNGKVTIDIETKDYDDGCIKIYVSDKQYLYKVDSDGFDIEGYPATFTDLTGELSYKQINLTTYEITLAITNNGNIDATDFYSELTINNKLVKQDRSPLTAGATKYIKYNHTINSTGNIVVEATIDTKNETNEVEETNNYLTKTISISFQDVKIEWAYMPQHIKVNYSYNSRIKLVKEGAGAVSSNLTIKLDNTTVLHSEIISFSDWKYDSKYKDIPFNISTEGDHNITVEITPLNTIDRNMLNNHRIIQVVATQPKATIYPLRGIPSNNITDANGQYRLFVRYNTSTQGRYTTKITTTEGIDIIGENTTTRYVLRYGRSQFRISTNHVSNNETITISIYDNETGLKLTELNKTIKISDPPVVIKYANITHTNSTQNLTFKIFNTTTYDLNRTVEYFAMLRRQGRVLNGVEYLSNYPHGCIEQTTSPMIASLYVKKYVNTNNISSNIDYDAKINQGIERLTTGAMAPKDMGNGVYAWGLWGNWNPKVIYTAYVLYGLTTTKIEGQTVNQSYIDNGIKYILISQNADGSWNNNISQRDYRVDNLMRTKPACNSLITLALIQTYNTTSNDTLKAEIFNATNKSVRYLISQDTTHFDSYDYGFMAWALSEAYNMGINDTNVSNKLNEIIDTLNTISFNSGAPSYGWYGTKAETIAIASIGLQKAEQAGFSSTYKYVQLNNNLTELYSPYGRSGWGSTKSTGMALRALTESNLSDNSEDTNIVVKINGITVKSGVINNTNPRLAGRYSNDTVLVEGINNITFETSNNITIIIGAITHQTTPYSIAINSNGKDYIDPLATDFNLTITTTRAIEDRTFNMTFNIANYNDTYPIDIGILEIKLPDGLTNATNLSELNHASMIKYNDTTKITNIYIYPETINKSSSLLITIPVKVSDDNSSKTVEAVFYPMYNEETIAPASTVVSITPLRNIGLNIPTGWSKNITETENRTIITIAN